MGNAIKLFLILTLISCADNTEEEMKLFISSLSGENTLSNNFPLAEDGYLYIIAAGQSNMVGKYPELLADADFYPGDRTNPVNTFVPNGSGGWKNAEYGATPFDLYNNNIALSFCREMNVLYPDVPIRLVFQALGGTSVTTWLTGGINRVPLDAIYDDYGTVGNRTDIYPAALWLWHQGEEDKNMSTVDYVNNWETVLSQFKAEGYVVDENENFICGEIAYNNNQVQLNLNAIADISDRYRITQTDGAEKGDTSHFLGTGLSDIGERYVLRYKELIFGISPPTDEERPSIITTSLSNSNTNDITVNWTQATDNVGVVGYDVYSQTGYIYYGSTDASTFSMVVNWTKAIGENESFTVLARDLQGNSSRWEGIVGATATRP